MPPRLHIEDLSETDFRKFKEKYLDDGILSKEAIKEIRELFGIGDAQTGYISCDEMHGHEYKCVQFYNPMTGIVNRLIDEIHRYQSEIDKFRSLAEKLQKDRGFK